MKTTLVFGASLKPERYTNMAIKKLRRHQHTVKAFGLKSGLVDEVSIDTELMEYTDIDTVTLDLNPKRQEVDYDYIIRLKPKRIIINPGIENAEL